MATIAFWNNHKFEVSASVIRSFTGLQVKSSAETEDKTKGSEQYTSFKSAKPTEINMTARLNAFLGCDVQKEALAFVEEARWGKYGYFYAYLNENYTKLIASRVMLTNATVGEIEIAPSGQWLRADVQLTFKAKEALSSASSSSSSKSSSSSSGSSYSKTSVSTTSATTVKSNVSATTKNVTNTYDNKNTDSKKTTTSTAAAKINSIVSNAKKATASSVSSGGGGKVVALTR